MRRFRLKPEGEFGMLLEVEGVGALEQGDPEDDFVGTREVVSQDSLTSLRNALIRYAGANTPPREFVGPTGVTHYLHREPEPYRTVVHVVDVPQAKFVQKHSYEFSPDPVDIVLREGGHLAVRVQFLVDSDAEPDLEPWRALLAPWLRRSRASIDGIDLDSEGMVSFRGRKLSPLRTIGLPRSTFVFQLSDGTCRLPWL